MCTKRGLNDQSIKNKLKEEDPVQLPMNDLFFEKMHDQIMARVEKTEIKPLSRWAKTWVFLEKKVHYYQPSNNIKSLKVVRFSLVGVTLTLGLSLGLNSLRLLNMSKDVVTHRQAIENQALNNPKDWIELVGIMQNENDFIAEVANEKMAHLKNEQIDL